MEVYDEIDALPDGFQQVAARDIAGILPRPTLIHLPGKRPALFVCILLHGNENVGLYAIQELLRRYEGATLPRAMSIFVGNVEACRDAVRYMPGQVDFNRTWPGSELPYSVTHEMLASVTRTILERGVFASVDLHNNTGHNPLYGCICSRDLEHVYLASLFRPKIVYFTRPKGVQTQAFTPYCPSVTCECGQVGDEKGILAATDFVEKCLELDDVRPPEHFHPLLQVYHTVARIKIRDHCTFGFEPGTDVVFRKDLDSLNFVDLQAGEALGTLSAKIEDCFVVHDEQGKDVTDQYLGCSSQQLVLERSAMPSMLTHNLTVIRQDCLGYLMERIDY